MKFKKNKIKKNYPSREHCRSSPKTFPFFVALLDSSFSGLQIIQDILGSALMVLVTVGYKTKLSALILMLLLSILNVYHNAWWTIPDYKPLRDFLKYDFFQVSYTTHLRTEKNSHVSLPRSRTNCMFPCTLP